MLLQTRLFFRGCNCVTCIHTWLCLRWCYTYGDYLSVMTLHARRLLVCDDVTCTETPCLWCYMHWEWDSFSMMMLHARKPLFCDVVTCTETPCLWWHYMHGDSLSVVLHARKRLVCDDVTCTETPCLWLCNTYTLKLLLCGLDMAYAVDKVLRTNYLLAYSSFRVWLMTIPYTCTHNFPRSCP